jgi:hypothetical protein
MDNESKLIKALNDYIDEYGYRNESGSLSQQTEQPEKIQRMMIMASELQF